MNHFIVRTYYAGFPVFERTSSPEDLPSLLDSCKKGLSLGEFTITFGAGQQQTATELCIDVYEQSTRKYRSDLSTAFKR